MVSRRVTLGVGLFALALLFAGLAFATTDFHAMESNTAADVTVGTARATNTTVPLDRPLQLVVLGDGPVAAQLGPALSNGLSPRFADIELADEPAAAYPGAVLVVDVEEAGLDYDPFSPTADVVLEFAFVGSGNGTRARQFVTEDQLLVITNRDRYVLKGDLALRDESRGIVTLPAYRKHVTERLVERLSASLLDAPGMGVES